MIRRPATDAASCSAERTTNFGSTIVTLSNSLSANAGKKLTVSIIASNIIKFLLDDAAMQQKWHDQPPMTLLHRPHEDTKPLPPIAPQPHRSPPVVDPIRRYRKGNAGDTE